MIPETMLFDSLPIAFALSDNVKGAALVLGLLSFVGGVSSLLAQKRQLDEVHASSPSDQSLRYESRKYRRRSMVSTLIASQGIMLCGIGFSEEVRTVAILVSIVLLMLVGVLGVAMFDVFSVGLNEIARKEDASARKALVEEYVRQRNRLAEQQDETEELGSDESR